MRKVLNTVPYFNIVAQTTENTVVTEYEPVKNRPDFYQSEAELEREFIILLAEQGYKYLQIHNEKDLIANLRHQLEELNKYSFSDNEWKKFFATAIANTNEGIADKSRKIQEGFVQVLRRDDGSSKNITLLDKKNIHNNRLQVINQYTISQGEGARHDNRYDVTILANGLPIVHVELKRRGGLSGRLLTRLTATSVILSGQVQDFLSMCRFSLFPMAPIPNIMQTAPDSMP